MYSCLSRISLLSRNTSSSSSDIITGALLRSRYTASRTRTHQARLDLFARLNSSSSSSSQPSQQELNFAMSVFNTSRLHDKTVLVTGASGGIGAAAAILFAKAGANVILTARRQSVLDEVAKQCVQANKEGGSGKGGKYVGIELDMKDKEAVDGLVGKIPQGLSVDILVNNAGLVYGRETVGEISSDDIDAMFQTNVLGLIRITQLFVSEWKKRQPTPVGHVINIGSVAGREAYPGGSIYCATKHAVRAFTGALLRESINSDIRVSEVQPGMVETEFSVTRFRGDRDAADKVYHGMQPLVADDIAEEIVWIASRPQHVNVAELYILPSAQGSAGLVHKK